jgi:hypothetical protein
VEKAFCLSSWPSFFFDASCLPSRAATRLRRFRPEHPLRGPPDVLFQIGTVLTSEKVLKELFDLRFEMFFPVSFVVHHYHRNVLILHILDESDLVVVKVALGIDLRNERPCQTLWIPPSRRNPAPASLLPASVQEWRSVLVQEVLLPMVWVDYMPPKAKKTNV